MTDDASNYYVRRANSVIGLDAAVISQFDMRAAAVSAAGGNCTVSCPSTSRTQGAPESGSNECFTVWEPVRLRQEWTIENIRTALELSTPGICMRSRAFKDESMPDISWQLCLYPGGKREENKGNVSLFLKMSTSHASKEFTIRAQYCFYFINDHKSCFNNVNTGDFKVKPSKGSHSWGLRNIPRAKVLESIRSNDTLFIVCQINTVPDFSRVPSIVLKRESPVDEAEFQRDFLKRLHNMFVTGDGADFAIECDNKEFKVHRFVLMAHSEVFHAMFQHDHLQEVREGRLVMTDTTHTAVFQMLSYMYSGSLPDGFADEHAPALMQIADKYDIPQLKLLCQEKLIQRLGPKNIVSMMVLADTHCAEHLMNACIPVVKANSRAVISSDEWGALRMSNPELINIILEKIVIQDDPPPQKRLRLNPTQLPR